MTPNEVGGTRTLAVRVKSSLCCRYTTTSGEGVDGFSAIGGGHESLRKCTRRSARRSDSTVAWLTADCSFKSGWSDSNRRFLAPKASGVPLPDTPRCVIDPCGIRTRPHQLERLATSPEVERAVCVWTYLLFVPANRIVLEVGCKALESLSPGLQPGAKPSQLPAHLCVSRVHRNEKARSPLRDTGLFESSRKA